MSRELDPFALHSNGLARALRMVWLRSAASPTGLRRESAIPIADIVQASPCPCGARAGAPDSLQPPASCFSRLANCMRAAASQPLHLHHALLLLNFRPSARGTAARYGLSAHRSRVPCQRRMQWPHLDARTAPAAARPHTSRLFDGLKRRVHFPIRLCRTAAPQTRCGRRGP